jgi:tol-pal system protein YbgF
MRTRPAPESILLDGPMNACCLFPRRRAALAGLMLAVAIASAGPVAPPAAASPAHPSRELGGSAPVGLDRALALVRADLAAARGEADRLAGLQLAQLPQNYAAQVEVRLVELERRLQELTGQVEELGYRLAQSENRLERALNDIEYRLATLEGGEPPAPSPGLDQPDTTYIGPDAPAAPGNGEGSGAAAPEAGVLGTLVIPREDGVPRNPSPVAPPDGQTAALPPGEVQGQYDRAYGLLQRGDFAAAEEAFRQFLARNPEHPLASNAHYWLGETYYVRSRFEDAAGAFAEGYRESPRGAKAVDSLLKLGMSLAQLGRTQDACLTLDRLSDEFPAGPVAIQRRAEQERERLQCR